MDELIHIEVLDRHGQVAARHVARTLPVRIGRAYDNDLILEDPYLAPHHLVLERGPTGELEIVDAGSRNGLFRAGARQRITRARVDPEARYRAGKNEFRIRSSAYAVAEELVDAGPGRLRPPLVALVSVMAMAAVVLLDVWSGTFEKTELTKFATQPVLTMLALLAWAGAWALAGRLFSGASRFAAHVTVGALAVIGVYVAVDQSDYLAFALAMPGAQYLALAAVWAILAWALWRHLALALRNAGRGARLAAVTVASAGIGLFVLYTHLEQVDDLNRMAFSTAIKAPAVRLVEGSEAELFFQEAHALKSELASLSGK